MQRERKRKEVCNLKKINARTLVGVYIYKSNFIENKAGVQNAFFVMYKNMTNKSIEDR